ncbi:MAG: flagellar export chaperone FlgN [Deltaproteobacteria bacterium]|nr:flagellar export chaperone FlgN [Deltaproteobacteria bacterium]
MGLPQAVATASALRECLAREVERARGEREHLKNLDAPALLQGAETRAEFNATAARLQRQLADQLTEVATEHDLSQVTLEALAGFAPSDASALSKAFAEIRSLAAALAEIDQLNRAVAERALACVESYMHALSLAPQAYDRRGLNLSALRVRTTHSLRA